MKVFFFSFKRMNLLEKTFVVKIKSVTESDLAESDLKKSDDLEKFFVHKSN